MAQSYKVFIDNKPLIIASGVNENLEGTRLMEESSIEDLKKELLSISGEITLKQATYLNVTNPKDSLDLLFESFTLIEAAGGLVRKKDAYLFIKRNGFWDIPKGKLEAGESPSIAGAREVEEECGVEVAPKELPFCVTYHTYWHKSKPVLKRTYWYDFQTEKDEDLIPQIEEGITEVRWIGRFEWGMIHQNTFLSISEVLYEYEKKVLNL